jgi:hypothetical protein
LTQRRNDFVIPSTEGLIAPEKPSGKWMYRYVSGLKTDSAFGSKFLDFQTFYERVDFLILGELKWEFNIEFPF